MRTNNVHVFAMDCEGWSKLFANRQLLQEVGCSEECMNNLYTLSQELASLSFQIGRWNVQERQVAVKKVDDIIVQYAQSPHPLFVKKAFQEVQAFLKDASANVL